MRADIIFMQFEAADRNIRHRTETRKPKKWTKLYISFFFSLLSAPYLNVFSVNPELILIKENLMWSEALRYCRQNHVDLVSVHSEEIQRRVMNVVKWPSTEAVWLGLRHSCTVGIWFWVSGETVCYQNWAPGNGTSEEDCETAVRSGAVQSGGAQRWISRPETDKLNFICRRN
ncbi:hypothetical protein Q8A67_001671 [Cirrhinus molitorella]|uniref:C-type lectin domain-containing protein n=1 Tax=Cirrhinus molitorella TaxID=172907 RepID=A0AA88Q4L3_9TELE|nr:hypothetical protein Q8A67_001671 [Cirrhinus molitorella]